VQSYKARIYYKQTKRQWDLEEKQKWVEDVVGKNQVFPNVYFMPQNLADKMNPQTFKYCYAHFTTEKIETSGNYGTMLNFPNSANFPSPAF
jgi:hypothetical protein